MNMDLDVVRKVNGLAGKHRKFDVTLDAYTRSGYLAFFLYGLWLWFSPAKRREKNRRRKSVLMALFSVVCCSLVSFIIGNIAHRRRPFARDWHVWNFTGHKDNSSFPSNHTMNSWAVVMQLYRDQMPGRHVMAALSVLMSFSQIFAGIHYPTDILGSMGLGALIHTALNRSIIVRGIAQMTAFISLLVDRVLRDEGHGR